MHYGCVSVVIPSYNRAKTLPRAINSVLTQTVVPREVIVVDDGSTDETYEVVRGYGDQVRYVRQENGGPSIARNRGIEASTESLIGFLDSDDEWHRTYLQRSIDALEASEAAGLCFCDARSTYDGKLWEESINWSPRRSWCPATLGSVTRGTDVSLGQREFRKAILQHGVIGSPSQVVVRRALLIQVGKFTPSVRVCEDYDLWVRLSAITGVRYIDEVLVTLHSTEDCATRDKAAKMAFVENTIRILDGQLAQETAVDIRTIMHQRQNDLLGALIGRAIRFGSLQELADAVAEARSRQWDAADQYQLEVRVAYRGLYRSAWLLSWFRRLVTNR